MIHFNRNSEPTKLDLAIDEVFREMEGVTADSEEYAKMADQLTKLYALRTNPDRVSKDTLAVIAGNLLGIAVIVGHERAHVITTKALGFVMKAK